DSLASRLNLAGNATDNVLTARDVYAQESQRINGDASLTPAQKRQQITELGNRARSDIARTLGNEGTEAYAQRSSWLNMLQQGMAFSTTPPANSPAALGMNGDMVLGTVNTSGGGGPSGGMFVLPAERTVQPDGGGVRVMTFTASTSESPA